MRKLIVIMLAAVAASAASSAFAHDPATATAPAAPSTAAAAPVSKPASDAAPAQSTAASSAAPVAERESAPVTPPNQTAGTAAAEKPFKPPMGFKLKKKGGQSLYCKVTMPLGTHFAEETCMTLDQLKDFMARADSMRTDMQQHQVICGGAAGCVSN